MTAQGSAVTRLQRAIANPNTSATQIRAIARELPTVGLEDALAILLALLDREPQTFERAGARYPVGAWGVFNGAVFRPGDGAGFLRTELSGMASLTGPAGWRWWRGEAVSPSRG
jgi:hypothetical protein